MKRVLKFQIFIVLVLFSLFIIGCHKHNYTEEVINPTCVTNGYTVYTCSCGDHYNDNEVEALGHTYGDWKVVKEATETETGLKERKCIRCNDIQKEDIPSLSHTHSYTSVVTKPTCVDKGYTTYTCTCGDSYKDDEVDAIGHTYGEWKVVKEATETETGLKERKCNNCSELETQIIPTLSHTHSYTSVVTKPTCTTKGYTTYTCSCGDSYTSEETNIVGHTYSNWKVVKEATEDEEGLKERKCIRCNDLQIAVIPVLLHTHSYTSVVTNPTCTEKGYTTYTCKCGDSYKDNEVDELGHSYESVVTNPTCIKKGYTTYTCKCGDSYTGAETNALGHSYGSWKVVKEATTTQKGLKEKECVRCNDKVTEDIPMLSNELVNVDVTFDLNKGTWDYNTAFENKEVLKSVTLSDYLTYDTQTGARAALTTTAKAVYWKYIVLVETEYEDIYKISEIVYQNSNITTTSYSYVVMWYGGMLDTNAKNILEEIYNNSILYVNKYVTFDNLPSTAGTYSFTMNIIETDLFTNSISKTYKNSCSLPTPIRTGYNFKGWKCSLDNKLYKSYPGYKSNPGKISYIAQWEINSSSSDESLNNTFNELLSYFDGLGNIKSNISLPTSNSQYGTTISYSSSNNSVLSNKGVYNNPSSNTKVTMTITISKGSNSSVYTYEFNVEGSKMVDAIASTYVYRDYDKLTDTFFETMDIIYCAFVLIDVDGGFTGKDGHGSSINYTNNVYLNRMKTYVINQAHAKGAKVIASIGGGGASVDLAYEEIVKDDKKIETLANNCVKLINEYGFDGVDIDWEIPDNGTSYTKLVKKIYEAVKANNPNHIVTSAIGGGMWQPPKYDLNNSKKYLDYINLMTYEMVSNGGYHHSALYSSNVKFDKTNGVGHTLTSCSISESVKFYKDNYGIPASQLIVGAAFYGKLQKRDSLTSAWTASKSVYYTSIKNDYLTNSNYEYYYDTNCQAPYLLSKDRLEFISFEDPKSIKAKCEYIISTGCAGIMYWENGCDSTGDLVQAIKDGLGK